MLGSLTGNQSRAASIGVDFATSGIGQLNPTDVAGLPVDAQSHYNDVIATGSNIALVDSNGSATTATLTITSGNFSIWASGPVGTDETLNTGFVGSSSGALSFTLSGIPYASYSIVVYDMDQFSGEGITIGSTTYYGGAVSNTTGTGYIDRNASTPFTYTQATSTSSGSPTAAETYTLFNGLSGATQTITATANGGTQNAISGFQIVPTPEPGSAGLFALGSVGMLARRSRRTPGARK